MMNFLRKHKIKIFMITIFGFLAGSFVGFGSYLFGSKTYHDTVAVVNGYKIPYKTYYSLYNNAVNMARQTNQNLTEETFKIIQNNIVKSLIQDEIIWQQTEKYGIFVSDLELARDIQSYPYFLNEQNQFDSRYYFKFLNNMMMTPKEFENLRRKQIGANKMQLFIASSVKLSPSEIKYLQDSDSATDETSAVQIKANEILNDWFDSVKTETDVKITLENQN